MISVTGQPGYSPNLIHASSGGLGNASQGSPPIYPSVAWDGYYGQPGVEINGTRYAGGGGGGGGYRTWVTASQWYNDIGLGGAGGGGRGQYYGQDAYQGSYVTRAGTDGSNGYGGGGGGGSSRGDAGFDQVNYQPGPGGSGRVMIWSEDV